MFLNTLRVLALVSVFIVATTATAAAETREERRVATATDVLERLQRIPEQRVPPTLLANAYGIAIIPNTIKVGLGVGARHGKGILVVRREDGTWSNPAFVALTGGSLGWQIGAQSADIVLVFKSRRGVDGISNGKLTLGADASVAAGPVGRRTEVATDISLQAEVVSYSRSRGLFAGVALSGAGVTMDRKANANFYRSASMTPEKIFASAPGRAPAVANEFVDVLTAKTAQLPASRRVAQTQPRQAAPAQRPAVRTYAVPSAVPGDYSQPASDEADYVDPFAGEVEPAE